MINLDAARQLKHSVENGFDKGGMCAAEDLIASIEAEYGDLNKTQRAPAPKTPQTLGGWQKAIHQYAKDKGWWDPSIPRTFGDLCVLLHSEISEAYEEYRNGHEITEVYFNPDKPDKPEGIPVELADVVIRLLDTCEWAGIDLQAVIAQKHAYNLTRGHRHGGKRV